MSGGVASAVGSGRLIAEHDFGGRGIVWVVAMQSEDLRREALALSDDERADLAADLLVSLEQPESTDSSDVRSEWAAEIERRARRVLAGDANSEGWATVRKRVADSLNG